MVWDPAREVFILHGGRDRNWDLLAETWEWAPGDAEWSRVVDAMTPNPGPRMSHAMVWDSTAERVLLFGGYRDERSLNDTWAYDSPGIARGPLPTRCSERQKELQGGDVERHGGHRQQHVARLDARLARHRRQEVDHGRMGDLDALGPAG